MSIKSKIGFNALFGILLALGIGVVFWLAGRQINIANQKVDRANKIVAATSEMRFVTFEYLLNQTDRSLEQWQLKYADISELLNEFKDLSPEERQIVVVMQAQHDQIKNIFNRLVTDYQNRPKDPTQLMQQNALDNLLVSQLLVKQQIKVTNAFRLSDLGRAQINHAIRRSTLLILVAVVTLVAASLLNFLFINFTISRSLARLQKGAAIIARGKLGYRLKTTSRDEFGQLANSFNSMAASLENIDKVKSEFIFLASHQLRMPLTAVKWSVEELLRGKVVNTATKQKRYLQQVYEANERMIKLVGALLNVTKIDFGALEQKADVVELPKLLDGVLNDLQAQLRTRKVTISKVISKDIPPLYIDPTWLRIILQNLLANAIRYSPKGGKVTITAEQPNEHVLLKVSDNGLGIPDAQKAKIFTKFFRADNAQKKESEGFGLGLYIVKAMVELAKGEIWFESQENHGTTFYVKLPKGNHKPQEKV